MGPLLPDPTQAPEKSEGNKRLADSTREHSPRRLLTPLAFSPALDPERTALTTRALPMSSERAHDVPRPPAEPGLAKHSCCGPGGDAAACGSPLVTSVMGKQCWRPARSGR